MSKSKSSLLFTPIRFGSVKAKNRIVVSAMSQYSAKNGFASTWHLAHLGARAIGGAGIIVVEAAAVEARGRISDQCLGIYKDDHVDKLKEISEFIKSQGSVPAIQLAHSGRKGSRRAPWLGREIPLTEDKAWEILGPSAIPYGNEKFSIVPKEATLEDISEIRASFVQAAKRSLAAGFEIIEYYFAHGFLVSSFLSPLANKRTDQYGGSFENRIRLAVEIIEDVQTVLPKGFPIFVRLLCTDHVEGGWTIEESVQLARRFKELGVALVDCTSSGNVILENFDWSRIEKVLSKMSVKMATRIQREADIATGANGGIVSAKWAEKILQENRATLIFIARASLDDPNWPLHAALELDAIEHFPPQYEMWIGRTSLFRWRQFTLPNQNQYDLLDDDDADEL